jgi:hypothetical protein
MQIVTSNSLFIMIFLVYLLYETCTLQWLQNFLNDVSNTTVLAIPLADDDHTIFIFWQDYTKKMIVH